MKAVVLESMNGKSAVLRDDGIMENVNKELTVGDTIIMEELTDAERGRFDKKKTGRGNIAVFKRVIAAAAALILMFIGGGIYSFRNIMACSYVTVDVNPSFEFSLNRNDKVIEVKAINEDAAPIVAQMKVKGCGIGEALTMLKETLKANGYLQDETAAILVDIVPENEKKRASISGEVEKSLSEAVVVVSTKAERKEAIEYKISTGRFAYAKANKKAGQDIDVEAYRKKAVSDVVNGDRKPESTPDTVVSGDVAKTEEPAETTEAAEETAEATATPTPTPAEKKKTDKKKDQSDELTGDDLQATPTPAETVSDNNVVSENAADKPDAQEDTTEAVVAPTPTPAPKKQETTDGSLPPEAPEDFAKDGGDAEQQNENTVSE